MLSTPALLEFTPSFTKTLSPSDKATPSIVSELDALSKPPSPSARTNVVVLAVDAIVKLAVVAIFTDFLTSNP